jgi:hypothetical protein
MFLFQRAINTDDGWDFVGAGDNIPRTLLDPKKEYRYFFISTEV